MASKPEDDHLRDVQIDFLGSPGATHFSVRRKEEAASTLREEPPAQYIPLRERLKMQRAQLQAHGETPCEAHGVDSEGSGAAAAGDSEARAAACESPRLGSGLTLTSLVRTLSGGMSALIRTVRSHAHSTPAHPLPPPPHSAIMPRGIDRSPLNLIQNAICTLLSSSPESNSGGTRDDDDESLPHSPFSKQREVHRSVLQVPVKDLHDAVSFASLISSSFPSSAPPSAVLPAFLHPLLAS